MAAALEIKRGIKSGPLRRARPSNEMFFYELNVGGKGREAGLPAERPS